MQRADWNLPNYMQRREETALQNSTFKKAFRATFGKAKALWYLQSQSTVFADALYEELNKGYKLFPMSPDGTARSTESPV